MLTLNTGVTGDKLAAKQDVGTDVVYEINGDDVQTSPTDTYGSLAQGALSTVATAILGPGAGHQHLVSDMVFRNTSASAVRVVTLYKTKNSTTYDATTIWASLTLGPSEAAEWTPAGWSTYNSKGLRKADGAGSWPTYLVNVKDFGAKGDDSTDDTQAIKDARDYGVSNYGTRGFTLYFPEGYYRISSVLAFTQNNLTIRGAGRGVSKIVTTAGFTTGDVITFGAQSQVSILDISLWSNESRTTGSGFALNGTSSVVIDGVFIWNQFVGVNLQSPAQLASISNATIHGPANDSYGIIINSNGFGDFVIGPNVVISQTNAGSPGTGLYVQGSLYLTCLQTDIVGWKNGLNITPAVNQDVTWSFFTSVLFDTSGEHGATVISGGATQKVKGIYFTNCWFSSSGVTGGGSGLGNGLNISAAAGGILDDIKVVGSRMMNNKNHGTLLNLATNVNINCCSIWGNSVQTANTYDGVIVKAGTTDFGVQDCLIGGASTSPFVNQQKYGVEIEAGASDRYTVLGNDVTGNTTGNNTGGIIDGGTGLDKQVDNNIGSVILGGIASKTTTSVTTAGGEVLITPAQTIAPRDWKVGTVVRLTAWGVCTGVAGTAIFKIRAGTAGTVVGDAAVLTGPTLTTAIGTAIPWRCVIEFTVTAIGVGGTITGTFLLTNDGVTGISNAAQVQKKPTVATFATTTITKIEATLVLTAASNAATVEGAVLEIVKL